MLLAIGGALLALMGVSCGITVGLRVSRGEERPWSVNVLPWAIGCHGSLGVLGLYLIMRAVA